jgi:DNA replication and repair protein RecF
MIGSFRSVLFYPDNLEIVKGGPEERRSFLNVAISQCYPSYIKHYSSYKKALENRNCLLKLCSKGLFVSEDELKSWSYSMADYASFVYLMREEYLSRLAPHALRIMLEISDGNEKLDILHECDVGSGISSREEARDRYLELLSSSLDRERAAGVSLFGPHRDDISLSINSKDSRLYASQGQQRSLVLALKLAEGEVVRELTGEYPVYLFDDVLSELDEKRRRYVLSGLGDRQIIITSCESEEYEEFGAKKIDVSEGVYVPSHR